MKQERDFIPARYRSLPSRRQFLGSALTTLAGLTAAVACGGQESSFDPFATPPDRRNLPKGYPEDVVPIPKGAKVVWVDVQEETKQKFYKVVYVIEGMSINDILNLYRESFTKNGFLIERTEVFKLRPDSGVVVARYPNPYLPVNSVGVERASWQQMQGGEIGNRLRQVVTNDKQLAVNISIWKYD